MESQVRMRAAQLQQPHPQQGNRYRRIPKALPGLRVSDNRLPTSPPCRLFPERSLVHRRGAGKGRCLKMSLYPLLDSAGRNTAH